MDQDRNDIISRKNSSGNICKNHDLHNWSFPGFILFANYFSNKWIFLRSTMTRLYSGEEPCCSRLVKDTDRLTYTPDISVGVSRHDRKPRDVSLTRPEVQCAASRKVSNQQRSRPRPSQHTIHQWPSLGQTKHVNHSDIREQNDELQSQHKQLEQQTRQPVEGLHGKADNQAQPQVDMKSLGSKLTHIDMKSLMKNQERYSDGPCDGQLFHVKHFKAAMKNSTGQYSGSVQSTPHPSMYPNSNPFSRAKNANLDGFIDKQDRASIEDGAGRDKRTSCKTYGHRLVLTCVLGSLTVAVVVLTMLVLNVVELRTRLDVLERRVTQCEKRPANYPHLASPRLRIPSTLHFRNDDRRESSTRRPNHRYHTGLRVSQRGGGFVHDHVSKNMHTPELIVTSTTLWRHGRTKRRAQRTRRPHKNKRPDKQLRKFIKRMINKEREFKVDKFVATFWEHYDFKKHFSIPRVNNFIDKDLPCKPTVDILARVKYSNKNCRVSIFKRIETTSPHNVDFNQTTGNFTVLKTGYYFVQANITIVDGNHPAALYVHEQPMLACHGGGFPFPKYNSRHSDLDPTYRTCNINGVMRLVENDIVSLRTMDDGMEFEIKGKEVYRPPHVTFVQLSGRL